MRPAPLSLCACLLLAACSSRPDTFRPRIVVTQPEGGGASRSRSFVVRGYVLDDRGVRSLKVRGVSVPLLAGEKIQPFSFRTLISGNSGSYVIEATDTSGNVSTLTLPVQVDTQPPQVSVRKLEREGQSAQGQGAQGQGAQGQTIRVSGVATDDQRVAQVIVDGNRLNITPGPKVEFYAESPGTSADIEVLDAAGNRVRLKAR